MFVGTVKNWTEGNWGFIRRDDGGEDAFAHGNHIVGNFEPRCGVRVSFDLVIDARTRRLRADKIVALEVK
jgi:cold shock CspA family protein